MTTPLTECRAEGHDWAVLKSGVTKPLFPGAPNGSKGRKVEQCTKCTTRRITEPSGKKSYEYPEGYVARMDRNYDKGKSLTTMAVLDDMAKGQGWERINSTHYTARYEHPTGAAIEMAFASGNLTDITRYGRDGAAIEIKSAGTDLHPLLFNMVATLLTLVKESHVE